MLERRRLRIAVSGLVLWLRDPLYGEVIKQVVWRRHSIPIRSERMPCISGPLSTHFLSSILTCAEKAR